MPVGQGYVGMYNMRTYTHIFFTMLGNDACVEGSVRLVNSSIALEGGIEVCHDGVWSSVCGGGLTEGYVICRILGYDAGNICITMHTVLLH